MNDRETNLTTEVEKCTDIGRVVQQWRSFFGKEQWNDFGRKGVGRRSTKDIGDKIKYQKYRQQF